MHPCRVKLPVIKCNKPWVFNMFGGSCLRQCIRSSIERMPTRRVATCCSRRRWVKMSLDPMGRVQPVYASRYLVPIRLIGPFNAFPFLKLLELVPDRFVICDDHNLRVGNHEHSCVGLCSRGRLRPTGHRS